MILGCNILYSVSHSPGSMALNDRPVEWTECVEPHEVYDVYCNYLLILKMAVCNEPALHRAPGINHCL